MLRLVREKAKPDSRHRSHRWSAVVWMLRGLLCPPRELSHPRWSPFCGVLHQVPGGVIPGFHRPVCRDLPGYRIIRGAGIIWCIIRSIGFIRGVRCCCWCRFLGYYRYRRCRRRLLGYHRYRRCRRRFGSSGSHGQ